MTQGKARPPRHLKAATKKWWSHTVETWALEEHHVRLLTLAAEAWDRCQEAREVVAAQGLTFVTKDGGYRANPAVRIEQDSRLAFARCLRELDLDLAPPPDAARPPALRSIAGAKR